MNEVPRWEWLREDTEVAGLRGMVAHLREDAPVLWETVRVYD